MGDGDDPAIWIHPPNVSLSKIVITTKSDAGAEFTIFDMKGTMLQHAPAEQSNNVDVITNFTIGKRRLIWLAQHVGEITHYDKLFALSRETS